MKRGFGPFMRCELLFQRRDKTLTISSEALSRTQHYGMTAREGSDWFRQRICLRYFSASDEHWNQAFTLLKGGLDFNLNEIIRVVLTSDNQLLPTGANDRQKHVRLSDLCIQNLDEIITGFDLTFHIHEHVIG